MTYFSIGKELELYIRVKITLNITIMPSFCILILKLVNVNDLTMFLEEILMSDIFVCYYNLI